MKRVFVRLLTLSGRGVLLLVLPTLVLLCLFPPAGSGMGWLSVLPLSTAAGLALLALAGLTLSSPAPAGQRLAGAVTGVMLAGLGLFTLAAVWVLPLLALPPL